MCLYCHDFHPNKYGDLPSILYSLLIDVHPSAPDIDTCANFFLHKSEDILSNNHL